MFFSPPPLVPPSPPAPPPTIPMISAEQLTAAITDTFLITGYAVGIPIALVVVLLAGYFCMEQIRLRREMMRRRRLGAYSVPSSPKRRFKLSPSRSPPASSKREESRSLYIHRSPRTSRLPKQNSPSGEVLPLPPSLSKTELSARSTQPTQCSPSSTPTTSSKLWHGHVPSLRERHRKIPVDLRLTTVKLEVGSHFGVTLAGTLDGESAPGREIDLQPGSAFAFNIISEGDQRDQNTFWGLEVKAASILAC